MMWNQKRKKKRERGREEKLSVDWTYLSWKRCWMSFSWAEKNSSSSDSVGFLIAAVDEGRWELASIDSISWEFPPFLLEWLISLLMTQNYKWNECACIYREWLRILFWTERFYDCCEWGTVDSKRFRTNSNDMKLLEAISNFEKLKTVKSINFKIKLNLWVSSSSCCSPQLHVDVSTCALSTWGRNVWNCIN